MFQGYRGSTADITERHDTERRLRQAEKMDALGNLTGGIAHDFNNTLLPLLTLTELTLKGFPEGSKERERLEKVVQAARRGADLVRCIMVFSREEAPKRERTDLSEIFVEAMELLHSTLPRSLKIKEHCEEKTGFIMADSTQIVMVMMNLVNNAAHAMDGTAGVLEISASEEEVSQELAATVPGLKAGSYAKLTVNDTGHGMDEKTLEHVFDPFFTTKGVGEGTGLGLSQVHGIVAKHDGAISISSTLGKGTTVEVYFPLV